MIYDHTRSLSIIYGSLTIALVFLYSVYLYASALLLGAEIAAAWSRPVEPTDETVLGRPAGSRSACSCTRSRRRADRAAPRPDRPP